MSSSTQPDPRRIGRFHIVTDFHFQQRFSHASLAELAIGGGADTIQFRQKRGGIRHLLREARTTADVCQTRGVPLIVDDRVDIALAVRASGVHVGQTDIPVAAARRVMGSSAIIGATATNVDQARRAQEDGATYIGFGPVFSTGSKANPAPVKGLRGLGEVCHSIQIPVIAIAGITPDRVQSVMNAGAFGFAVMTGVTTSVDPTAAARSYRNALSSWLKAHGR